MTEVWLMFEVKCAKVFIFTLAEWKNYQMQNIILIIKWFIQQMFTVNFLVPTINSPSFSSGAEKNNKQNTERANVVHSTTLGTDFI